MYFSNFTLDILYFFSLYHLIILLNYDDLDHVEGPIAKRQKIDASDSDGVYHQCTCFLVTKVTGISSKYNTNNMSISIKGMPLPLFCILHLQIVLSA